jgi:hypothetical protein
MVTMTAARRKIAMRVTAAAIAAAGIALVVAGAIAPPGIDTPSTPAGATTKPAAATQPRQAVDLSEFLDVDLHRPLVDAKPPTTSPAAANPDPLQGLRLVGTVMETGHCFAVFTTTAGKTEIVSVAQPAGGGTLTAVAADSVTLRVAGRSVVLHAVKPPSLGQLRP